MNNIQRTDEDRVSFSATLTITRISETMQYKLADGRTMYTRNFYTKVNRDYMRDGELVTQQPSTFVCQVIYNPQESRNGQLVQTQKPDLCKELDKYKIGEKIEFKGFIEPYWQVWLSTGWQEDGRKGNIITVHERNGMEDDKFRHSNPHLINTERKYHPGMYAFDAKQMRVTAITPKQGNIEDHMQEAQNNSGIFDQNELCYKQAVIGSQGIQQMKKSTDADRIKQFCEKRDITTLFHFTRIENLRSILEQGLLGRSFLEGTEQNFQGNDKDRYDGVREAICLSISFPNYKMFYSYRESEKQNGIGDSQWVVLLLDAKVLWELDCLFCKTNAASESVRSISREARTGHHTLEEMFQGDRSIFKDENSPPIPMEYPTDPQAEVLVLNPIYRENLKAVHFYSQDALKNWTVDNPTVAPQNFSVDETYFRGRCDWEKWQKQT